MLNLASGRGAIGSAERNFPLIVHMRAQFLRIAPGEWQIPFPSSPLLQHLAASVRAVGPDGSPCSEMCCSTWPRPGEPSGLMAPPRSESTAALGCGRESHRARRISFSDSHL